MMMPLTEMGPQLQADEYGKFSVPRKVRKRGILGIGPGLEAREKFLPFEKNIHASTYLMNLVNWKPREDLPKLDVLGEYLGFYDDSGKYRNCPVKYCTGPSQHEMHLLQEVKDRGMGPSSKYGEIVDPEQLRHIHHDADVVMKSKFPLWF